jgi:hypothetical protein
MSSHTKTDGASRAGSDVTAVPDGVGALLDQIAQEQKKIDQHKGDVVASIFRIAQHLTELCPLVKENWASQLAAIGVSTRDADRYLKIGNSWLGQVGLNQPDLLRRLPDDLAKLAWLCRVPQSQLPRLLDELDCRKVPLPQVIAAVRKELGEGKPARADAGDVGQLIKRRVGRLVRRIKLGSGNSPQPEALARLLKLLAAGLDLVERALR